MPEHNGSPPSLLVSMGSGAKGGHPARKERALPVEDGPQELHGRKLALVFSGLMLVMLLAALDSTIVATALPTIAGDLGGLNHISWVTTAYLLAQTVVTPLYGKLGDQYGRRIAHQRGPGLHRPREPQRPDRGDHPGRRRRAGFLLQPLRE